MAEIGVLPGRGMTAVWRGIRFFAVTETTVGDAGEIRTLNLGHFFNGQPVTTARLHATDDGGWTDDASKAGGDGNLLFGDHKVGDQWENGLIPLMRAFLKMNYDGVNPNQAPVTNAEPFTGERFNFMISEYLDFADVPGQDYPEPVFKAQIGQP